MIQHLFLATLLTAVTVASPKAQAALFAKKPIVAADEAVQNRLNTITIWVDASWGFRSQGAANSLNDAHRAFDHRGYRVHSVVPYIENGDLQGFFVTYERRDPLV
ncbi:hypothetical protein [Lysobacter olei]